MTSTVAVTRQRTGTRDPAPAIQYSALLSRLYYMQSHRPLKSCSVWGVAAINKTDKHDKGDSILPMTSCHI